MRHETLPPDHLFGRRLEMLTLAVMASCARSGNWHRIAREWIYGDEPVTELGRQEAEFYAARPPAPAARRPQRCVRAAAAALARRPGVGALRSRSSR